MKKEKLAIILLIVLIAIGGVVMYGENRPSKTETEVLLPPSIKGPTTPPPGYVAPR